MCDKTGDVQANGMPRAIAIRSNQSRRGGIAIAPCRQCVFTRLIDVQLLGQIELAELEGSVIGRTDQQTAELHRSESHQPPE
jgi:hypothetical protein